MKIKLFILILIVAIVVFFFLYSSDTRPELIGSPHPIGTVLFMDTYENEPEITKTTHDLWMKFTDDAKNKKDYWADEMFWLESGRVEESGRYRVDPSMGEIVVTEGIAHEGIRSAEVTIAEVSGGNICTFGGPCHYIRNPNKAVDGVYEVGAWFYVPSGQKPRNVQVAIEDHLYWKEGHLAHGGVDPETGTVGFWSCSKGQMLPDWGSIGTVDFQYDTWFKIWIVYDTRKTDFEVHYKSPTEEKTFITNGLCFQGPMLGVWRGVQSFNFYAGAKNVENEKKQKLYADDFYAKVVG